MNINDKSLDTEIGVKVISREKWCYSEGRFKGLDVGPIHRAVVTQGTRGRVSIRVPGYSVTFSRWEPPTFCHPVYYCVKDGLLAFSIEYTRQTAKEARRIVEDFLNAPL